MLLFGWFAGWGLGELERQSARRVAAEYTERQVALALDIHDFVSHRLASVLIDLQAADPQRRAHPEFQQRIVERLDGANAALRGLALELHRGGTPNARSFDPAEALEDGVAELGRAGFRLAIGANVRNEFHALGHEEGLVLGRLLHEALHNVAKHGDAHRPVDISASGEGRRLVVEIANAPARASQHSALGLGLAGMRQRAGLVGGTCTSTEAEGQWVCRIDLPLGKDASR